MGNTHVGVYKIPTKQKEKANDDSNSFHQPKSSKFAHRNSRNIKSKISWDFEKCREIIRKLEAQSQIINPQNCKVDPKIFRTSNCDVNIDYTPLYTGGKSCKKLNACNCGPKSHICSTIIDQCDHLLHNYKLRLQQEKIHSEPAAGNECSSNSSTPPSNKNDPRPVGKIESKPRQSVAPEARKRDNFEGPFQFKPPPQNYENNPVVLSAFVSPINFSPPLIDNGENNYDFKPQPDPPPPPPPPTTTLITTTNTETDSKKLPHKFFFQPVFEDEPVNPFPDSCNDRTKCNNCPQKSSSTSDISKVCKVEKTCPKPCPH